MVTWDCIFLAFTESHVLTKKLILGKQDSQPWISALNMQDIGLINGEQALFDLTQVLSKQNPDLWESLIVEYIEIQLETVTVNIQHCSLALARSPSLALVFMVICVFLSP